MNALLIPGSRPQPLLSAAEFAQLAEVPPEAQWFANLSSAHTRRAYQADLKSFMRFAGLVAPEDFRAVSRGHVLAWRAHLESQSLQGATIRRKLAALSSLYEFLCESNAVLHNPVQGVTRPRVETYEGKTPALGNSQAVDVLEAPRTDTLKGVRDRGILSILLFHGLRREELTKLLVKDFRYQRRGVPHLRVHGKGGKMRFVPLHPHSQERVEAYLRQSGHAKDLDGPLFRPVKNPRIGSLQTALTPGGVYTSVVQYYLQRLGITGENLGPHALRATAATCALECHADIAKVQEWLGHAHISTTRVYDRRTTPTEESPTYKVRYEADGTTIRP